MEHTEPSSPALRRRPEVVMADERIARSVVDRLAKTSV